MKFTRLSWEEYDAFQQSSPCRNFLNSVEAIKLQEKQRWSDVQAVGVKDADGKVIAAAPLAFRPAVKFFKYCLSQRGLLLDYHDKKLLKFFTEELRRYLRGRGVMYLEISPIVEWRKLDLKGEVVPGTEDSEPIKNLLEVGFLRRPNAKKVDFDIEVPREYVLSLRKADGDFYTADEFLKTIHGATRRAINHLDKNGVRVRVLAKDELKIFHEILTETAKRKGFMGMVRSLQHYQDEFEAYGEKIKFYLSYLDCDLYLQGLKTEKAEITAEKKRIKERVAAAKAQNGKVRMAKFETQMRVLDEALEVNARREKKIKALKAEHGKVINLSTAMFIDYPNESVYLSSGSREEFKEFDGPLAIQWFTIKKCLQEKVPLYNFYGISGDFSDSSDEAGVLGYKANFHGEIREKIGEFYLPVNSLLYGAYRTIKRRKW